MAKKTVAIVLLSILAAALIVAMVFFIGNPGVFPWNRGQQTGGDQQVSEPAEFDPSSITTIKIDLGKNDVSILGSDSDKIRVEKVGAPGVTEAVSGSDLVIKDSGMTFLDFSQGGRVTVYVPEKCDLDIDTASGDVKIESFEAGYVKADTASGDVLVKDSAAGHIETNTASGDVKEQPAWAASVRLTSASPVG